MTLNVDALIHDMKIAYKTVSSSKHAPVSSKPNPPKSTIKANALREVGNKLHNKKKFDDSLFSYTASIAYSLDDSEELCKAYANRSASLFELRKYASCLFDINRALKSHCTEALRQKLLDRKERCLAQMRSSAGGSGDADDEIDEDALNPPTDREPSWRADLLSKFGNALLPNASPKIKLKYDKEWGRHFVATADIEPGEPLLSENYFVTMMFSDDSRFAYCDFCIASCKALIPCLSCARTMYCSEQCRTRAYDSYHQIECKISSLVPYGSVYEAVAIRMFLTGTQQGKTLENLMNTLSIADIFAENFNFSGKPTGSDYVTALRLTRGAFDVTRVQSRINDAVRVIIMLRGFKFFESVPVDHLKDAELFATALLLNGFSSNRYLDQFKNIPGCKSPNSGKGGLIHGVILLRSFFNHSCFPNVSSYLQMREHKMLASRPIKKDEQLFIAYDSDFVDTPKAERIQWLGFICHCEACSNNWPTYFESGIPSLSMDKKRIRTIEDFKPSNDAREFNRLLSETMDIVAPLLDDTTLISLRVDEISRIIARTISLLYKVMIPMSFPIVELRYCLYCFTELYYDERERDPIQNRTLEFPISGRISGRVTDDFLLADENLMTTHRYTMSKEMFYMQAVTTIFDAVYRLKFYLLDGRLDKKIL